MSTEQEHQTLVACGGGILTEWTTDPSEAKPYGGVPEAALAAHGMLSIPDLCRTLPPQGVWVQVLEQGASPGVSVHIAAGPLTSPIFLVYVAALAP